MPAVFRFGPYRFFFFSGEGREPVHVHAEAGDGYAKFWVRPVRLARSVGFRGHELNEIHKIIEEHVSLIEERWNEHFRSS